MYAKLRLDEYFSICSENLTQVIIFKSYKLVTTSHHLHH